LFKSKDIFQEDFQKNFLNSEDETRLLRETINSLRKEVSKFKNPPLVVCEVSKMLGEKAIIRLKNGHYFCVPILKELQGKIHPNDTVLAEQKSLTIIEKVEDSKTFDVEMFVVVEKPKVSWDNIGGLKEQIKELKEVIELPMKNPQIFKSVGIEPPKGVLLHGFPGCGKTLLAKAVASSTNATFIEVPAPQLNQKFIGDGAKLVNDIFKLAKEKAPSIIFIDEIDALASTRVDQGTSGEREVQRTLMQFLYELDGFKSLEGVNLIAATNRLDVLDEAILRPGRFDRLIEVGLPDKKSREKIFAIHTRNMKLNKISRKQIIEKMKGMSGAEIKGVCTEAGYFAIREGRKEVNKEDFLMAVDKIFQEEIEEEENQKEMFG